MALFINCYFQQQIHPMDAQGWNLGVIACNWLAADSAQTRRGILLHTAHS